MCSWRLLIAGTLAILASSDAWDADFPVKAPSPPAVVRAVNWTGYFGGHAGYSWGRWNGVLTSDTGAGLLDPLNNTINAGSWFGGVQIGFTHQL